METTNVITIIKNGISETPVLIRENTKADAYFENKVRKLLGEDADELNFMDDMVYEKANRMLNFLGYEITYFTGIEVN